MQAASARRLCGRNFQKLVEEGLKSVPHNLRRRGFSSTSGSSAPQLTRAVLYEEESPVDSCTLASRNVAEESSCRDCPKQGFLLRGPGASIDSASRTGSGRWQETAKPPPFGSRSQYLPAHYRLGQLSWSYGGNPQGRHRRNASRALFSTTSTPAGKEWSSGPSERLITDASAVTELALDSVVKIFTMASSPNYFLPWQNKPQREITGSGMPIHAPSLTSSSLGSGFILGPSVK